MQKTWTVKQGDSQFLTHTLRDLAAPLTLEGPAVDLTGIDSLHVAVQRVRDNEVVVDGLCNVIDLSEGIVAFPFSATASAVPGLYRVEVIATWPGSKQISYPVDRRFWYIDVRGDIAGSASPLQTAPPTLGGTPVTNTLFVADGETVTVTTQGSIVFAGATANVVIAEHVEAFSIAPWTTETSWSVGNVPTIGQAGSTLDPSVSSFMEAATGDAVVVAKNTATSVWFAASSTQGATVLEIGHGSTLPVDGTVYQLFDLEGDAMLPNGMYRWDEQATVWQQIG